jgi:hypothetical protein
MAGFVDGTPELMEKTDSGTSNPPPMGFSERELYIALRIDMTAADARRLAMEMALAQEVAERLDKEDTETVDPASESRIETNIASYTLQLLACQGGARATATHRHTADAAAERGVIIISRAHLVDAGRLGLPSQ